jgi:hypothetical protein
LISQKIYKKAQRGATLSTQGVYKGELGGIGKKGEKIRKTNHPWGQPAHCPGEKGKKEKVEEFLNRPRGILETSIVSLTPNTPHNTKRDHFPNNSTPRTATRPPISQKLLNRAWQNPTKTKPVEEGIPQGSRCPIVKKKMINRLPI